MSKIVIRNGIFETNSSSVHSICISKKPVSNVKGKKIAFYLDEYGWEHEIVNATPDYLYTAIMCHSNSEELLDKLKSILDKYEIDYTFQPKDKAKWYGIDHGYETDEFVNAVLDNEDLLLRYLFDNESVIYTGNDNCDSEDYLDTCFIGNEYYWGDGGKKLNPYHDSENFDYFIKGN